MLILFAIHVRGPLGLETIRKQLLMMLSRDYTVVILSSTPAPWSCAVARLCREMGIHGLFLYNNKNHRRDTVKWYRFLKSLHHIDPLALALSPSFPGFLQFQRIVCITDTFLPTKKLSEFLSFCSENQTTEDLLAFSPQDMTKLFSLSRTAIPRYLQSTSLHDFSSPLFFDLKPS